MSTKAKAQPAKAAAAKRTTKAAPTAEAAKGRTPVSSDAEISAWIRKQLAAADKAGTKSTTAGLLRSWREQGGQANPRRFAALVAGVR